MSCFKSQQQQIYSLNMKYSCCLKYSRLNNVRYYLPKGSLSGLVIKFKHLWFHCTNVFWGILAKRRSSNLCVDTEATKHVNIFHNGFCFVIEAFLDKGRVPKKKRIFYGLLPNRAGSQRGW